MLILDDSAAGSAFSLGILDRLFLSLHRALFVWKRIFEERETDENSKAKPSSRRRRSHPVFFKKKRKSIVLTLNASMFLSARGSLSVSSFGGGGSTLERPERSCFFVGEEEEKDETEEKGN